MELDKLVKARNSLQIIKKEVADVRSNLSGDREFSTRCDLIQRDILDLEVEINADIQIEEAFQE